MLKEAHEKEISDLRSFIAFSSWSLSSPIVSLAKIRVKIATKVA